MLGDPFCAGGVAGELTGVSDEEDAEGRASAGAAGDGETDGEEAVGAEEAFARWRRADLGDCAEDNGASEAKM